MTRVAKLEAIARVLIDAREESVCEVANKVLNAIQPISGHNREASGGESHNRMKRGGLGGKKHE